MPAQSSSPMRISAIRADSGPSGTRVRALVDDRELYFQFTGAPALGDIESAILVCCVYPAMCLGRPLSVDAGHRVSARLLANLAEFQEIYAQWWPELTRVPVEASTRDTPLAVPGDQGSMFSGGVDSFYTYLSHEPQITRIVFAGGLDIAEDEKERFDDSIRHYSEFAAARGKQLVTLWTNIKGFWPGVRMPPHHGQVLAAFGIMLGFSRTLIPATHTYAELAPWGSHPLTDPLFCTEATTTVHHGAMPRREKIRVVGRDPACMNVLRVCNSSDQYNCGVCEKCLRTRMSLRLLGLHSDTLPALDSLEPIRKLRLYSENDSTFWMDNLALAQQSGDREAEKAIQSVIRNYEVRRGLKRMRSLLSGG